MAWHQKFKKAVTFSYDGGALQDIRLIELLNQYGLKCTFNLNSGLLGTSQIMTWHGKQCKTYKISPQDVRQVYAGHEVAVHTLTHPNLTTLEDGEIIRQVEQDRKKLSELAGYEVVGMAYPCGGINHDARVEKIIREHTGIRYSRTITNTDSFAPQPELLHIDPNVYHLEWERMFRMAEEFLAMEAETPKMFYVWGHSYELDYAPDYWRRLEDFFQLISGRKDVFYGTNKDVLL